MLSNLPLSIKPTDDATNKFNSYTQGIQEFDATILAALKSFFENRGFNESSADTIASILYMQSKSDGYNPMQILDTLKGLSNVELSSLVSEILNYNRFKSSNLGIANEFAVSEMIDRNIIV